MLRDCSLHSLLVASATLLCYSCAVRSLTCLVLLDVSADFFARSLWLACFCRSLLSPARCCLAHFCLLLGPSCVLIGFLLCSEVKWMDSRSGKEFPVLKLLVCHLGTCVRNGHFRGLSSLGHLYALSLLPQS